MDNFNAIVSIIKETMPLIQSGIPALVGGFVTAMFLRGNTRRSEFEKIKVGKINEVLDDLVDRHELTFTELVKCKNLLQIAKIADDNFTKKNMNYKLKNENKEFDFDWFFRFFESAGNVSKNEMQIYWAKLLSNEVKYPGSVHPAFIEIMKQLSQLDAQNLYCFRECNVLPIVEYCILKKNGEKETLLPDVFLSNKDENDLNKQSASISNLLRLGLIFFSYKYYIKDDRVYEPFRKHDVFLSYNSIVKDGKATIRKGKLMLSPLGTDFINICFTE